MLGFTTEFSNFMAIMMNFPKQNYQHLINGITKSNSLTSLEFYICLSMKLIRKGLDHHIIQKLYEIDSKFQSRIRKAHKELYKSLEEFNKLGFDLF